MPFRDLNCPSKIGSTQFVRNSDAPPLKPDARHALSISKQAFDLGDAAPAGVASGTKLKISVAKMIVTGTLGTENTSTKREAKS
jgi:hypothetical protein